MSVVMSSESHKNTDSFLLGNKLYILFFYSLIFTLMSIFAQIVLVENFSFYNQDLKPVKIFEGYLLTCFSSLFLSYKYTKPSDFLLHLHFLIPIVPMLVLYGVSDFNREIIYASLALFLFVCLIASKFRVNSLEVMRLSISLVQYILLLISLIVISSLYLLFGLSSANFDLSQVYFYREMYDDINPFWGYLISFTSKVFLPFVLLISIIRKNFILAILCLLFSIILFGLSSHKSVVAAPFIIIIFFWFLSSHNPIKLLIYFVLTLFLSAIGLFLYTDNFFSLIYSSFAVRRIFFEPALLNFFYHDFFKANEFIYWSNSKISFDLLDYPYDLSPAYLIGKNYMGSSLAGANTGWIGSGFMNFGYQGMLIYAVIVALILCSLNGFSRSMDKRFVTALSLLPLMQMMTSSDLPVSLLNHGLIMVFVLLTITSANINSKKYAIKVE